MTNFAHAEEGSGTTTCFAALVTSFHVPVGGGLGTRRSEHWGQGHVTIGVNKAATPDESAEMEQELREIVDAALPFDLVVTDVRTVGIKTQRPALICEAVDPVVGTILSSFYKRHSKRAKNGCPLAFSDLTMHVTLDESFFPCEEEEDEEEEPIVVGTRITVNETIFISRNDAADASNVYNDTDWTCLRCGTRNPLERKLCTGSRLGIRCQQWRPKVLIERAHKKREGDWQCCGEYQYASRTECRRCNASKKRSNRAK